MILEGQSRKCPIDPQRGRKRPYNYEVINQSTDGNTDYLKELYKDWTEFRYLEFDYQMAGDVSRRGKKTELIIIKHPEVKVESNVNALESLLY